MQKLRSILFVGVMLVTLNSCVKELGSLRTDFKSSLVINSIFSPDSLWTIDVSNTANIFSDNPFPSAIDNANIRIENLTNNTEIYFENLGQGKYKSQGHLPIEGHYYEIFIDAEGYDQAYSATYVPSISEPQVKTISEVNIDGAEVYRLEVTIPDNPFEDNYYIWEVHNHEEDNPNNMLLFDSRNLGNINSVLNQSSPDSFNPKFGNLVFVNDLGQAQSGSVTTSLVAIMQPDGTSSSPTGTGTGTEGSGGGTETNVVFDLKVRAVSKDLYLYAQSLEEYQESGQTSSSAGTPNSLYSNIESGKGIFGAYSQKLIRVER